jgi:trans-aconitate methyltransferase
MQSQIKLKFTDVNEYRKAIGRELLSRMGINFSSTDLKMLEIGPGQHSELVSVLKASKSDGTGIVFIEPHLAAATGIQEELTQSRVIGSKIEVEGAALPAGYFDGVYANFSLHWSDQLPEVLSYLYDSLKSNGVLGFTITDQSRSFWASMNLKFKSQFPGCDLFNAPEAKGLGASEWKELLTETGFTLKEELIFEGMASASPNAQSVLENFQRVCGDKYLKLSGSVTRERAEAWLVDQISRLADNSGLIPIPASGLSLVAIKS